MSDEPGKLFGPGKLGTLEVPNRFVRSATAEYLSDEKGSPLPELGEMYRRLAEGGVGLIVTGHAYVHPGGRVRKEMSGIYDDALIPAWHEITDIVHGAGAKIAMQINHGGRQCMPGAPDGPMIAPSPIPVNDESPRPIELTERGIHDLIRAFADAAGRVKEAGFDAVQIHSAHGYLISCFNSPASNWRHDAWGGKLSHRIRFLEQVADAVRNQVGDDYPVLIKLGAVDSVRDGLTEEEGVEIISHLADMGLDGVEISGGIGDQSMRAGILRPDQEAYFLPIARRARQVTDLPLILVGGLRSRGVMNQVLEEGSADFISVCRPVICEPDFPRRIRDGQERATCISCGQCWPRKGELGISCHYLKDREARPRPRPLF
jgi:2,4-dienoyl-CoA reductase-like NADH-dependent reductase (Old Yellow Enzyme family)